MNFYLLTKRLFDMGAALPLLILFAPLMIDHRVCRQIKKFLPRGYPQRESVI